MAGGGGGGGGGGAVPKVNLQGVNLADPNAAGIGAFLGQQSLFPQLSQFTGQINQTAMQQYTNLLNQLYPGATTQLGQISNLANQYLSGQIPSDVQQQIQRATAQQALVGGYGGTGMGRNLTARDLGLTSLNLQQTGLGMYEAGLGAAKGMIPGFINPGSLLFSPSQLLARTDQANYYNTDIHNQQQQLNAGFQQQQNMMALAAQQAGSQQGLGMAQSIFGTGQNPSGISQFLGGSLGNLFGGGSGGFSGLGSGAYSGGGGLTVGSLGGGGVSDFSSLFGSGLSLTY